MINYYTVKFIYNSYPDKYEKIIKDLSSLGNYKEEFQIEYKHNHDCYASHHAILEHCEINTDDTMYKTDFDCKLLLSIKIANILYSYDIKFNEYHIDDIVLVTINDKGLKI